MKAISPTLAICATALLGAAALLALPADAPSTNEAARGPADSSADSPTDGEVSVELVIESFAFATPTVRAGAPVRIVNRDSVEHTVTGDNGAFDTTIAPGATATFDAPATAATYTFVCVIHPAMTGSLVVR